ncbi:MAG: TetR/AcrR family transcriptional regulator [Clostridiales bacterium]|nr:TetR/AcrR family transcriptional regulator [Clostridiales bacterium]
MELSMKLKMSRGKSILYHSNELFLENGYDNTTMRQIAEVAGVSLGLTTYHFKTKRFIAVTVLEHYLRYLKAQILLRLPPGGYQLERSSAMIHLCAGFFMQHPCRKFYLECLTHDIYMESIQKLGNEAMKQIARENKVEIAPDLLLLFDNYIPPAVERILFLEKEKGNFSNIKYEDIPGIVFSIAVEHYIDKDKIDDALVRGHDVAFHILREIPQGIAHTLFLQE